MIMKKRITAMLLMCAMVISLLSMTAFAAAADNGGAFTGNEEAVDSSNYGISLYTSNCPVDNEKITTRGASWIQPFGYSSYKIWVQNTTNYEMTITHTSGLVNDVYYVAANSSDVILVVNSAVPFAQHKLDFMTETGEVSGYVSVRVSTVDQYYYD